MYKQNKAYVRFFLENDFFFVLATQSSIVLSDPFIILYGSLKFTMKNYITKDMLTKIQYLRSKKKNMEIQKKFKAKKHMIISVNSKIKKSTNKTIISHLDSFKKIKAKAINNLILSLKTTYLVDKKKTLVSTTSIFLNPN